MQPEHLWIVCEIDGKLFQLKIRIVPFLDQCPPSPKKFFKSKVASTLPIGASQNEFNCILRRLIVVIVHQSIATMLYATGSARLHVNIISWIPHSKNA